MELFKLAVRLLTNKKVKDLVERRIKTGLEN